jgi:hypothetical protein
MELPVKRGATTDDRVLLCRMGLRGFVAFWRRRHRLMKVLIARNSSAFTGRRTSASSQPTTAVGGISE